MSKKKIADTQCELGRFPWYITHVKIYDRVLSPADITKLYNKQKLIPQTQDIEVINWKSKMKGRILFLLVCWALKIQKLIRIIDKFIRK